MDIFIDTGDIQERKSYPVILEAKPQHSGQAILNMTEEVVAKEEDNGNNSNLNEEEITVNGVLLQPDSPNGSATIVQYAIPPKMEGEEVQVK